MKNFIFNKIIGNKLLIFIIHAILIAMVSYADYRLDSTISLIIFTYCPSLLFHGCLENTPVLSHQ
jgi:hypothetical protein